MDKFSGTIELCSCKVVKLAIDSVKKSTFECRGTTWDKLIDWGPKEGQPQEFRSKGASWQESLCESTRIVGISDIARMAESFLLLYGMRMSNGVWNGWKETIDCARKLESPSEDGPKKDATCPLYKIFCCERWEECGRWHTGWLLRWQAVERVKEKKAARKELPYRLNRHLPPPTSTDMPKLSLNTGMSGVEMTS